MITVIVYGRNDSYGYNLAKRAAISINCIAEVLDHKDDEIIFVDCNTPNDIPTFPESIADTLTPRAKNLLRVLRLRPEQYERGKNGSRFKVLEPLCRNVAIRRSNPANRWILNTNTDMVFTPLEEGTSLSSVVSGLPDGFYELPRFEMPESLWESTDRSDPAAVIRSFRTWGLRLHLNEIVTASKEVMFDGPGDFQLSLRSQLIAIHGMNEQMTRGWHVDSNLCKRMFLLNGETRTVLSRLHAFHCDHTRIQTVYHVAGKSSENSYHDFVLNVTAPHVPEQAATWGLPDEPIEEIRLDLPRTSRVHAALERLLPGMAKPIANLSVGDNAFDASLYYDHLHVFPYVADIVANFSPYSRIGYVGIDTTMFGMLSEFRRLIGHTGPVVRHETFLAGPESSSVCGETEAFYRCDAFVVDLSMNRLPSRLNQSGLPIPGKCREVAEFVRRMSAEIIALARREKGAVDASGMLRPFIFIGCHSTSFDPLVQALFSCAMTPVSTYVRSGTLSSDAFKASLPIVPVHFYVIGGTLHDMVDWISSRGGRPVRDEDVTVATNLYNMFVSSQERQRALDALETLLSFDAGRGMLQMQMDIAEINGLPEQAESLRRFIEDYQRRPYDNGTRTGAAGGGQQ